MGYDPDEPPSLLRELERAADPDHYDDAIASYSDARHALECLANAVGIAFELGKYVAGDPSGVEALREKLLRGPKAGGDTKRREADKWREPAKQLWRECGGKDRSMSQPRLALLIQKTIRGADDVTERTVIETIQKWERESGSFVIWPGS